MRKFEYRAPRYLVDLPVELRAGEWCLLGRCREISRHGMLVEFCEPLATKAGGVLTISYKTLALELRVSTAHSHRGTGGVKFIFESEQERDAVERLISMLSSPRAPAGPRLLR